MATPEALSPDPIQPYPGKGQGMEQVENGRPRIKESLWGGIQEPA